MTGVAWDARSLLGIATRWTVVEATTQPELVKLQQETAQAILDVAIPILQRYTPPNRRGPGTTSTADPLQGPAGPDRGGKRLYETTEGAVLWENWEPGSNEVKIILRQTATTSDGRSIAGLVIRGRGAIVTPAGGWPSGAKALWTPWGPRRSVKAAPPNPYPDEAMKEIRPAVRDIMRRSAFGFTYLKAHELTGQSLVRAA